MISINIRIDDIKNLLLNLIGSAMLAFGVCAFVAPFDMIVGGATGIALITHKLTGISVSVVALIVNMLVLVPGYILGSKKLVFGSILSSIFYPLALGIFEKIPSITTIADNSMLATICGGVVCGAGIGLVIRSGGSTGGLDIPVLLVNKYFHIPVDIVMNCTDSTVMLAQLPFSPITGILYGLIFTFLLTNTLNHTLTLGADRMKVSIVSEMYEEICHALTSHDFGATMIYAEGGYTKTPIKKIESIMVSDRYRKAQKLIEEIDPAAFITIEKVKDVKGRGFTLERELIEMD